METNRTKSNAEWAPPPPVVMENQPVVQERPRPRTTPPPLPSPRVTGPSLEAEFEATLGSLVEHYSSLPPAEYGEPPELDAAVRPQRARRRDYVWWWAGSLVLGAALAGGGLAGYHLLRGGAAAAAPPEIPIVVRSTPLEPAPTPRVEPLVEEHRGPVTSALEDDATPPAVENSAVVPAAPVQKVRRPASRKVISSAAEPAGAVADPGTPAAPPARPAEDKDWEDPYR